MMWLMKCRKDLEKNMRGSRMIVNGSFNLVEFYVKMGKMNCDL